MADARTGHVHTSDGRRLTYRDNGDPSAPAVVGHHGTPGSRLDGHPDEDAMLAELGLRLVTYDRPGYGESDPQPGRRVVDAAADVAAIADQLGIERFAVVGTSGGGPPRSPARPGWATASHAWASSSASARPTTRTSTSPRGWIS